MNFSEGVQYMQDLVSRLEQNEMCSFSVGDLVINYPGYKKKGDYQLTVNGTAPKHSDIVNEIFAATNEENLEKIIDFLSDVYTNGLNATSTVFPKSFIEKIYWITLQEEINYPQPRYKGRKLPFQRFYEGALAKVAPNINLKMILIRTNNHGREAPKLFQIVNHAIPSFYI